MLSHYIILIIRWKKKLVRDTNKIMLERKWKRESSQAVVIAGIKTKVGRISLFGRLAVLNIGGKPCTFNLMMLFSPNYFHVKNTLISLWLLPSYDWRFLWYTRTMERFYLIGFQQNVIDIFTTRVILINWKCFISLDVF